MATQREALTEGWLRDEVAKRAASRELKVECLGAGRIDRRIAIVSDYPGDAEVQQGRPLVGPTGVYAGNVLRTIGVKYSDCYVTNLSKRQPDFDHKAKTRSKLPTDERAQWKEILQWELSQLPNLEHILVMGNHALYGVLGEDGITNWRGTVCDVRIGERIYKVTVTHNPAYINTDPRVEPVFKFDIKKFGLALEGKFRPHTIRPHINPTYEQALEWIEYYRNTEHPVAFDIETIHAELACVGFADNAHEGHCINLRDRTEHRFTVEQEIVIHERLQELFDTPGRQWIAQNGNFDSYFLWLKSRIRVPGVWFDTLLAHHTLFPRLPHGLGFLTSMYTTHPFYKDEGEEWKEGGHIDSFWEYNVKDCCITWAAYRSMAKELVTHKLDDFFFNHVMRLQPHLTWMTVGGIAVDETLREQIANELIAKNEEQLQAFWSLAQELTGEGEDYKPNPRSTPQMQELLFDKLGLVGHGRSNDKANRARIKSHSNTSEHGAELVRLAEAYIKDAKHLSTSIGITTDKKTGVSKLADKLDEDRRARCEYKQFGTQAAPGRLSSTQTLWGSGWNLQNVPHQAYKMFTADDGYEFTYFDKRQAEAKVVAYQWNVKGLKRNFIRSETEDGFDLHRGNAAQIFRLPYDQIPKHDFDPETHEPTMRYLGKRCVHGLNYRMSPTKLAEVCNIPLEQAYSAYTAYHRTFPEIRGAWSKTTKVVTATRQLWTPLGRRLIIMERLDDSALESIVAFIPQSTIGDMVSKAIYGCHEHPAWPHGEARMALNIHDALIAIHLAKHGELVEHIMREVSEQPLIINDIDGNPPQEVVIFSDFKHSKPGPDGVHRWSTI